jgi:F-type H+-transporting ATPase subunit b
VPVLPLTHFAAEGGLAALGLNVQSFVFQLITFVIVLLILRAFVYKKLVATLEDRRNTVETSIEQAAETERKLKEAETTISGMLTEARTQADEIVAAGHKEVSKMVEEAETKAAKRAEHIVADAKAQMDVEVGKAREQLKAETLHLVALATEQIISKKLDAKQDTSLISDALANAQGQNNG